MDTVRREKQYAMDPDTSRSVTRWTHSSSTDQHLYFTTPCVTQDGRYLAFISERGGAPNLYVMDRQKERPWRVSDAEALRRSYVYPRGTDRGFAKPSPCLDPEGRTLYWIQDDEIRTAALADGSARRLAPLPVGSITGYMAISFDGRSLCVPCADAGAFSTSDRTQHEQLRRVPRRLVAKGLTTTLLRIDTETGMIATVAALPFWVTHVQFDPSGSGRILCNSEGPLGAKAIRSFPYWGRMWVVEPDGHCSRLFEQPEGETANHENCLPDGSGVLYHGREALEGLARVRSLAYAAMGRAGLLTAEQRNRPERHFVAARRWDGELLWKQQVDTCVNHAVATPDARGFTMDTCDGWIHLYIRNPDGEFQRRPLCRHGSSMEHQDAHVHPVMTPDGTGVIFTSDVRGSSDVYEVDTQDIRSTPGSPPG